MGVNGLWRLVEPTGKPVPVETLENKILAVDISIWLHQMVKGYQDAKGAPLPNAHLMGLFQRLCKLLYFRIKPVFVFDGAFPELKKETIAKRQDNKSRYQSESERLKRELALLLSKKTAVNSLLGKKVSPKKSTTSQPDDDIFKLPAMPEKKDETESESDDEDTSSGSIVDLHTIDLESENFKKMDVKEKYDLLVELKETRKMNSWGKLHEMPKKSDNFSDFQMQRLLKRRKVQECLQETEKEMGSSGMSLNELESLLNEEGIDTKLENMPTRHIASNNTTRFLLISDMKKAIEEAKNREIDKDKVVPEKSEASENKSISSCDLPGTSSSTNTTLPVKDELEEDLQKAIQMSLQNSDEPNTSFNTSNKTDESWSTFMTDSEYSYDSSDSDEKDGYEPPSMSSAKAYIMQYSDFTSRAIDEMVKNKSTAKKKNINKPKIDEILNEINKEKSIIKDHVNLSSDEDDCAVVNKTNNSSIIDVDALTCSESEINDSQDSSSVKSNNLHSRDEDNFCESKLKDTVIEDKCNSKLGQQLMSVEKDDSVKNIDHELVSPINIDSDEDEELKKAIQMSLECVDEPPGNDKVNSESNSSDDDFEEVTDVNPVQQPVIQLSFDVNQAPEDDIFADVFACTKNEEPPIFENVKNVIKQEAAFDEKTIQNEKIIQEDCNDKDEPKVVASSSKVNMEEATLQTVVRNQIDLVDNSVQNDTIHSVSQDEERDINNTPVLNENKTPALQSKGVINEKPKTSEELVQLVQQMENKEDEILQEKGRLDRVGRNITEQMTKEAQELLQIFGIPYIVAPMEAEAQCAFLENTKLTDGTITDDSDIWLFGGKTVYKNFFNQKKHVLQFISERIERSFNLPREQLILLAMLVGSDYTAGISGVGPVTALEILASFPYNKKTFSNESAQQSRYAHLVAGLQEFKKWVRSGKKTDNTSLKKKLRNVNVFDDFPSVRVVQAYMEPNIDKNESKFSWGEIDITVLRDYTKAKFGWSQHKLDEIVKPVLKRLQDRNSQKTIQDYFTRKVEFQNLEDQMSKRVKAAVQKMGPDQLLEEAALEPTSTKSKKPRKRKTKVSEEKIENVDETEIKRKHVEEIPSIVKKVATVEPEINKEPIDIKIRKTDRYQEIIPQREKDKKSLLENKMKAIEVFRKTKLDTKHQRKKKKPRLPKEKADLSETDSD